LVRAVREDSPYSILSNVGDDSLNLVMFFVENFGFFCKTS
jgi:hypothetical protein